MAVSSHVELGVVVVVVLGVVRSSCSNTARPPSVHHLIAHDLREEAMVSSLSVSSLSVFRKSGTARPTPSPPGEYTALVKHGSLSLFEKRF